MIRFLQTPGPIKKFVLGGLLLVICLAMLVYLIPGGGTSVFGGPERGVVAKVGGEDITTLEVQQQARQMLRQQFPRGTAQAALLLPFFASRAVEQLINERALVAEADRLGLRVTDEELRDELQHGQLGQILFPNGSFVGREAYEDFVARQDLTVPRFEQLEKDFIRVRKLRNLVGGGASVTDAEVHQELQRRNTKVKFEYAVLRRDDILKGLHPTEEELKAFYERKKAAYNNAIPEKRKVKYVLIDVAKIQAQTQVTHEDLLAYYDQHRDGYRVPEQVNVRHILIKTPLPGSDGKVDPKGAEEARKKAEDILKQLKGGANFAELAKKSSEDPGSAKNGGSLGWIGKGRTVPEFERAAFSLPKGSTSEVVQSSFGFHIIHVDDKQEAHVKTLAEVKDQIEPVIKQQKATHVAEAQANALLSQARSAGLEKAAAAKGLEVVTTDFFSRSDSLPGIGTSPQFMEAVFNEREKSPPDEVQLPQGRAVFELLAVKPPATPTFEEIRTRVESEFRDQHAGILFAQRTQELSDRAKAEHDLKKAAKELGATLKTSDFVLPDGQVPDLGSMSGSASVAFSLKPGEISGPIDNANTGAVLSLLEKQELSPEDLAKKEDETRDSLLQAKRSQIFGLFVANLREQMEKAGKIKINQDELKGLTRGQGGEEGE